MLWIMVDKQKERVSIWWAFRSCNVLVPYGSWFSFVYNSKLFYYYKFSRLERSKCVCFAELIFAVERFSRISRNLFSRFAYL